MGECSKRTLNLFLVLPLSSSAILEIQHKSTHVFVNHFVFLQNWKGYAVTFNLKEAVVIGLIFSALMLVLLLYRRFELSKVRGAAKAVKEKNTLANQKEIQFFAESSLQETNKFICLFGLLKNKQGIIHEKSQFLSMNQQNQFSDNKNYFCDFVCMVNQKCFFPANVSEKKIKQKFETPVNVDYTFPKLTVHPHKNLLTRKKEATPVSVEGNPGPPAELLPQGPSLSPFDQEFLNKIGYVVENNFADNNFSVDRLAFELNLSVSQVNRKLKVLTNHPAGLLLRIFRLHRAAGLIVAKSDPISEICFKVGFNSQQYFCRAFKKQFGCSPSVFRRKVIEKSMFMRQ